MIKREDILRNAEYWKQKIQLDLYNCAVKFMNDNNMNRTALAEYLGVSKGYITQLLTGEFDHRLSKIVELALAFGYVPDMDFTPIKEYSLREKLSLNQVNNWQTNYTQHNVISHNSSEYNTSYSTFHKKTLIDKAA